LDRLEESKFGLEAVGRSSEFRLGLLARRSGLLSLASWIKHGSKNRLTVEVESGGPVVVQSVHSRPHEPALPWLMVEGVGGAGRTCDCNLGAYGKVLHLSAGEGLRTQVSGDPVVVVRRGEIAARLRVCFEGREEVVEVAAGAGVVTIQPGREPVQAPVVGGRGVPEATAFQKEFVRRAREKGWKSIAVHTPRWLGVSNSTRTLFEGCYPVPNTPEEWPGDVTDEEIERHAQVLVEAGAEHVIFSGGDEAHYRLMEAVRRRDASVRFDLVFHGNFTQLGDAYIWSLFTMWCGAVKAGKVREFVTLKKGAEEVLRAAGVRSRHLVNYVPGETMAVPEISAPGTHVGVWFSGTIFKSANPMIAALTMVPGAVLHSAGLGPQGEELAEFLGIERGFTSASTVSREELERRIRATHVSLYVTSAECSPMLPLESLQLGVPCLIGPCCHLFEDNAFLHERLVVPYPDRPEVIARYTQRAVEERGAIIAEWKRYAPMYNERARLLVREFLRG
jgi:hypothetical protein